MLAFVVIDCSYLRFRALFTRGPKVHVGNNISATYPRRIWQGLNAESCILCCMLSSLMGLPNPAWASRGNVVSYMAESATFLLATVFHMQGWNSRSLTRLACTLFSTVDSLWAHHCVISTCQWVYPSKTKISEWWTKEEIRISKEALWLRTIEKSV